VIARRFRNDDLATTRRSRCMPLIPGLDFAAGTNLFPSVGRILMGANPGVPKATGTWGTHMVLAAGSPALTVEVER